MARKSVHLIATAMTLAALSFVLVSAQSSNARVITTAAPVGIPGGGGEQDDFMRRVYEAQVRRATGRPSFADLREDQLAAVEAEYKMRKDAAGQFKLLLKQAKSDLKREKEEGRPEALKVSDIGVHSAYRSVEQDAAAWRRAFKKHFKATRHERAQLKGGEYGEAAVELMVSIMRKFKAPPGFSRHTRGVAVDLRTTEGRVVLSADSNQNRRWKESWLHMWLVKNAGKFKFKPLATEAWHWEYTK